MLSVLTCIVVEHDLRLVVVAALVCLTACGAAFGFHLRSLKADASPMRWAWMGLTGLVAGSGVWATHFIAMLAYMPDLPMGYDPTVTAASLATAVIGMSVGFALPVLQPDRTTTLLGGGLTGLSVGAMHFMGIAAMRAQARIEWNDAYVIASIAIGALGAAAAFQARARLTGRAKWMAPAALLLLAIVGLHFTAMTAVRLVPDPTLALPHELAGRGALALATVVLAGLILAAACSLIWMERLGRRSTLGGLRHALDAVSSGLAFFDARGRLLSWNRAYAGLMSGCGVELAEGVTRESLVAAVLAAGWTPKEDIDVPVRRHTYLTGGRVPGLDAQLPDGRWIRHEAFVTPDGGGVTVLTDVTEQRETALALAEARDAAEAANRAKSQFLANTSHEIRTPLNGVLGVAEVLADTRLSARQRELVGVIRSSGALLDTLLADLLDLARVEAGAAELRPEPLSLDTLARAVADLYAPRARQKGLGLRLEIGPGAGAPASCDGLRLRQVLGNLVSNAIKFTEAGEVTIGLDRHGDRVTFEVRDTGVGFDEARKAALFGRFQQADESATRKHGGAGLGLAICREYVSLMGGELDCESAVGAGSVFRFTLDLPALAAAEPSSSPSSPRPAGRFRVLVVDDNVINRQVLGLILDAAEIEHEEAEDGRAAVEAAASGAFDAVLMDIQMPVMDGFEAIRRIRAWEAESGRAAMPIYVVSANGLQEHVDLSLTAGADGHLSKPVSAAQLLAILQPHAAAARLAA